jgi:hypothetical protein
MPRPRKGALILVNSKGHNKHSRIMAHGFLYDEKLYRRGATPDDFDVNPLSAMTREAVAIPDGSYGFAIEENTKRVWIMNKADNYYLICVPNVGVVFVDPWFCTEMP